MRPERSRFTPVARRLGRCAPIVLLALLLNPAAPVKVLADDGDGGHGRKGQGAFVQGLGSGTITAEVQPGTTSPCVSTAPCQITITGTATIQPSFAGQPDFGKWGGRHDHGGFTVQAVLTVALPNGTPNGSGEQCYPVTGSLSLTAVSTPSDTLVADVQGVDCAVGSSTTLSAIDATYVVDGTNSTGNFAGATGTGTVGAATDSSQSPPTVEFAFSGSLVGADQFHDHHHHH
jgi:hypothetical protein